MTQPLDVCEFGILERRTAAKYRSSQERHSRAVCDVWVLSSIGRNINTSLTSEGFVPLEIDCAINRPISQGTKHKARSFHATPLADLPLFTTIEQISYELRKRSERRLFKGYAITGLRVNVDFFGAHANLKGQAVQPTVGGRSHVRKDYLGGRSGSDLASRCSS